MNKGPCVGKSVPAVSTYSLFSHNCVFVRLWLLVYLSPPLPLAFCHSQTCILHHHVSSFPFLPTLSVTSIISHVIPKWL